MNRALEHLDEAEAVIMNYMQRISELEPDEDEVEDIQLGSVLMAVLRHVSRAAGMIEGETHDRKSG